MGDLGKMSADGAEWFDRDLGDRLERERGDGKSGKASFDEVFARLAGGAAGLIVNYAAVLGRR